jgi:DNA-directed RNA polymerase subunit RPC12/RpoP
MAAPFVVACSHCGSKLKLKDESFVGKKVRCPKCQEPFVVKGAGQPKKKPAKAKAPSDDDFGFLDDLNEDDFDGPPPDEEDTDADVAATSKMPSPVRRKTTTKGKKKKSGPGVPWGKIALISLLVLVGLATVGGMGYGVYWVVQNMVGGGRMAWLPDNTELFIEVRVADLWNSQALKPLTTGDVGARITAQLKDEAKVDLNDIERVAVGGSSGSANPVTVVYAKKPFDVADFEKEGTPEQYGGYTVYRHASRGMMSFLPKPTIGVYGPEADIKSAIDRKGACAAADKFSFAPSKGHLVFASTNPQSSLSGTPAAMSGAPVNLGSVTSVAAALTFTSNVDIDFTLVCADSAAAEKLSGEVQQGKSEAVAKFQEQKAQLQSSPFGAAMLPMFEAMEQVLNSLTVNHSGSSVKGKVALSGKLIEDVTKMAQEGALPGLPGMMPRPSAPPVRPPSTAPPQQPDFFTIPEEEKSPGEQPP